MAALGFLCILCDLSSPAGNASVQNGEKLKRFSFNGNRSFGDTKNDSPSFKAGDSRQMIGDASSRNGRVLTTIPNENSVAGNPKGKKLEASERKPVGSGTPEENEKLLDEGLFGAKHKSNETIPFPA